MNGPIFLPSWSLKKNSITVIASIAAIFVVLTVSSASGITVVSAQKSSPPPDHYAVQKTAESTVNPLPGHQSSILRLSLSQRDFIPCALIIITIVGHVGNRPLR